MTLNMQDLSEHRNNRKWKVQSNSLYSILSRDTATISNNQIHPSIHPCTSPIRTPTSQLARKEGRLFHALPTNPVHIIAKSVSKSGVAPFNSLQLNTISSFTVVGSPNVHSRQFPYCAAVLRVYSMLLMNGKQIVSVVADTSCARESRNWCVSIDIMCRILVQCKGFVALR